MEGLRISIKSDYFRHISRSRGEKKIEHILLSNRIDFKKQHYFDNLISKKKRKLRFDFAVFKDNKLSHLIEYDGAQHFSLSRYYGCKSDYLAQKENDKIKSQLPLPKGRGACPVKDESVIRKSFGFRQKIFLL